MTFLENIIFYVEIFFVLLMYISANNHFIITFSILVYIACDTTLGLKISAKGGHFSNSLQEEIT